MWLLGNLGRAGYGASLEGLWCVVSLTSQRFAAERSRVCRPYSYDSCDIGTLANQTDPTTGGPTIVTTSGIAEYDNGATSFSTSEGTPLNKLPHNLQSLYGRFVGRFLKFELTLHMAIQQSYLPGMRLSRCTCPGEKYAEAAPSLTSP